MRSTTALLFAAGALMFGANSGSVAAAENLSLHEPVVLPVTYDGLTRWCGPDELIGNTEAGQRLFHLDQLGQQGTAAGDAIDPVLLQTEVSSAEFIGCFLEGGSNLTYWKLRDPFYDTKSWLYVERLRASGTTPPLEFKRQESTSLQSGFLTWTHRELAIYVSYRRRCGESQQAASDDKSPVCAGIERIDFGTFARMTVMERPSASAGDGAYVPEFAMVTGPGRLSALVFEKEKTLECGVDETTLATKCRPVLDKRLVSTLDELPRRISVDPAGEEIVLVSGQVLVCEPWKDTSTPSDQPQCRSITLKAVGVERLGLEAILPDGRALVNADQCLSLAKVSFETGEVTDITCLLDPIKTVVPADIRDTLVPSAAFTEERDGITIPDWEVRLSPTGTWLAIQVPKAQCSEVGPTPETMLSRLSLESCGQLMIWPADKFIR